MRRGILVAVVAIALMATAGCYGMPTLSGSRIGVGQRELKLVMTGAVSYSRYATISSGSIKVRYSSGGGVDRIAGTVTYPSAVSGSATFSISVSSIAAGFDGTISVKDPAAGVDVTVAQTISTRVEIDGDGDISSATNSGGVTLAWAFDTFDAPGIEPVYDLLSAEEYSFCAKAQQSLAGLSESEVPLASIINNDYKTKTEFIGSKALLVPLTTQTWREAGQFDTANGNNIAITEHISCKTRSADHLATLGVSTGPDQECRTLNETAAALAEAQLTPAEAAAYAGGTQISFQPDVVRQTGVEWTTPLNDLVISGGVANLYAHGLLVNWTDPNFALFPDNIRGVHYCTVRSPAWFYWWFTVGAFL
jgi:hypothetical protein